MPTVHSTVPGSVDDSLANRRRTPPSRMSCTTVDISGDVAKLLVLLRQLKWCNLQAQLLACWIMPLEDFPRDMMDRIHLVSAILFGADEPLEKTFPLILRVAQAQRGAVQDIDGNAAEFHLRAVFDTRDIVQMEIPEELARALEQEFGEYDPEDPEDHFRMNSLTLLVSMLSHRVLTWMLKKVRTGGSLFLETDSPEEVLECTGVDAAFLASLDAVDEPGAEESDQKDDTDESDGTDESDESDESEESDEPEESEESDQPEESEESDHSDQQDQPDQSEQPEQLSLPAQSEEVEVQSSPGPAQPEQPEQPDLPAQPDQPEQSEQLSLPAQPEEAEEVEVQSSPGPAQPEQPEPLSLPAQPGPEEVEAQSSPGPTQPEQPEQLSLPAQSAEPEQSSLPAQLDESSLPAKAAQPQEPGEVEVDVQVSSDQETGTAQPAEAPPPESASQPDARQEAQALALRKAAAVECWHTPVCGDKAPQSTVHVHMDRPTHEPLLSAHTPGASLPSRAAPLTVGVINTIVSPSDPGPCHAAAMPVYATWPVYGYPPQTGGQQRRKMTTPRRVRPTALREAATSSGQGLGSPAPDRPADSDTDQLIGRKRSKPADPDEGPTSLGQGLPSPALGEPGDSQPASGIRPQKGSKRSKPADPDEGPTSQKGRELSPPALGEPGDSQPASGIHPEKGSKPADPDEGPTSQKGRELSPAALGKPVYTSAASDFTPQKGSKRDNQAAMGDLGASTSYTALKLSSPAPGKRKAADPKGKGKMSPEAHYGSPEEPRRSGSEANPKGKGKMSVEAHAGACEEPVRFGDELVGSRIRAYWSTECQWFKGTIVEYNKHDGKHFIEYDDGDTETMELPDETVEFIEW